jgi:hypothetical protein
MVTREDIEKLINSRLNQLLLVAETALPSTQFQAFRKITLNEFGNNGLGKELERLFGDKQYKAR